MSSVSGVDMNFDFLMNDKNKMKQRDEKKDDNSLISELPPMPNAGTSGTQSAVLGKSQMKSHIDPKPTSIEQSFSDISIEDENAKPMFLQPRSGGTPKSQKTSNNTDEDTSQDEKDSEDTSNSSDDEMFQSTFKKPSSTFKTPTTLSSSPKTDEKQIRLRKQELLYEFEKLEKKGIKLERRFTMRDSLDEMEFEYERKKKQRQVELSVKFQRKVLIACTTGMEFLNSRFNPFDVDLDGWSENINDNILDYDEILEELAVKYGGAGSNMAPELRLMFSLAGSAFMFSLSRGMMKKQAKAFGMDNNEGGPGLGFMKGMFGGNQSNDGKGMGLGSLFGNMMNAGVGTASTNDINSNAEMDDIQSDFNDLLKPQNMTPRRPPKATQKVQDDMSSIGSIENLDDDLEILNELKTKQNWKSAN